MHLDWLLTICVLPSSVAVPFVNHATETFKAVKERLLPVIQERLARMQESEPDQKTNSVGSVPVYDNFVTDWNTDRYIATSY